MVPWVTSLPCAADMLLKYNDIHSELTYPLMRPWKPVVKESMDKWGDPGAMFFMHDDSSSAAGEKRNKEVHFQLYLVFNKGRIRVNGTSGPPRLRAWYVMKHALYAHSLAQEPHMAVKTCVCVLGEENSIVAGTYGGGVNT